MNLNIGLVQEWVFALLAFIVFLALIGVIKKFLLHLHKKKPSVFILELAPSLTNLLFIVALKLFADIAPLNTKVGSWVDSFTYIFGVLILLFIFRKIALISIEWSASRIQQAVFLQIFIPLLRNLASLFIFLMGGIMVLKHFNYDVMSLLAALGVGSLAVGLASKEALTNTISGFIVLFDQNLRPGDRVNLSGAEGVVVEIGLRSTRIELGNGNTLVVPNSDLVNTKLINMSFPNSMAACNSTFRIPLDVPFHKISDLCFSAFEKNSFVASEKKPWVHLNSLSEGHQSIQVGFWIYNGTDSGKALSAFHNDLLSGLQENNIRLISPTNTSNIR